MKDNARSVSAVRLNAQTIIAALSRLRNHYAWRNGGIAEYIHRGDGVEEAREIVRRAHYQLGYARGEQDRQRAWIAASSLPRIRQDEKDSSP